jgi:hypothetical protein
LSASVVPTANDEFAGVIAIESRLGGTTVSPVDPEIEPDVAVIVALPAATPVARPFDALIVAVPRTDELQVTLFVMFCVLLSVYVPVAVYWSVVPAAMDELAGVTAIDTSVATAPVPVSDTVCGLLLALSTKLSVPVRGPVAFGENATEAVQLLPAESEVPHAEVTTKSVRLLLTLVIFREVVWLLVSVTVWAPLVVPIA